MAVRAVEGRRRPGAPAAGRDAGPAGPGARRDAQRSGAVRAAGRGAAAGAGQRRHVPAARHLHQHRRTRGERAAGGLVRQRRQPGRPGGRVAGQLEVVPERLHPGRGGTEGGAVGGQLVRPAGLHQQGGLGGAGMTGDDRRAVVEPRALHQHVPRVRVRRQRFGVDVVAVVPDDHHAEVADRREHRRPGAEDHLGRAPRGGQELAVALLRGVVGAQHGERVLRQQPAGGGRDAVEVLAVRDDDQRAPPSGEGRPAQLHQPGGPVLARQRRPDRPRRLPLGEGGRAVPGRPGSARSRPGRAARAAHRASGSAASRRPRVAAAGPAAGRHWPCRRTGRRRSAPAGRPAG